MRILWLGMVVCDGTRGRNEGVMGYVVVAAPEYESWLLRSFLYPYTYIRQACTRLLVLYTEFLFWLRSEASASDPDVPSYSPYPFPSSGLVQVQILPLTLRRQKLIARSRRVSLERIKDCAVSQTTDSSAPPYKLKPSSDFKTKILRFTVHSF
ncbi:hypothetical protein KQX54_012572 [Cotesia glomerata]|uniref:Uncharacterized protein n=1 Tax=Cotesia glomerata TaxID=32391 RepID=A0AAV7J352_COTGL|nr:hypothetical protein KQX54_012572 [Cotesia glomerata]